VFQPLSSPVQKASHKPVGVQIDDVTDYLTETVPLVDVVSLSTAGNSIFVDPGASAISADPILVNKQFAIIVFAIIFFIFCFCFT